ncbi:unnamed protein product [Didymodactylos carnosus]|uniref:Microbial-type PARG catalytic domain-containing protein n=1 Tax=Didymodactylos carnosus TaxID=1234261 RepID=A0A814XSA4_9BILA|nr:unnamed protein product [Didymodactylos carnosus]CAF1219811.1 unnamed protein product [Didymodactylos carnosus]CAF3983342.1 unnamed protein product [Didymodactylos carnosus]CAF3987040.1 unnamed protein product [Didymodactylos carnosus]
MQYWRTKSRPRRRKPFCIHTKLLIINTSESEFSQAIRNRLRVAHGLQVKQVKCSFDLDVGIVQLNNDEDKETLLNDIRSIVLLNNQGTITFVETIQLTSYVVVDIENIRNLPSAEELSHRWCQVFGGGGTSTFQPLSVYFPNIIKVTSYSTEELQAAINNSVFTISNGQIAHVYVNRDCSYLEDIHNSSENIDTDLLFCYIITQLDMTEQERMNKDMCQEKAEQLYKTIKEKTLSSSMKQLKSSLFIQLSKESGTAVILASKNRSNLARTQKFMSMTLVNVFGHYIPKGEKLACRLVVKNIPMNVSIDMIKIHPIFKNNIRRINLISAEQSAAVIYLGDEAVLDKCLKVGAIEIDHSPLHLVPYSAAMTDDPSRRTINVQNWYGRKMLECKPDIAAFAHDHVIFKYKWDPDIWLEQFKAVSNKDTNKQHDTIRRMLRVTVMLNTLATIRKGKYSLKDGKTEVILQQQQMKTIVYNHKSKLLKLSSQSTIKIPFQSTRVRIINEDCVVSYANLAAQGFNPLLLNMANATSPGGGYPRGDGAQEENLFRRSDYCISLEYFLDHDHPHVQHQRLISNTEAKK